MSTYDPADEAFSLAKRTFREQLDNHQLYSDILVSAATIDDVYQLAAKLQEDAASRAGLRHLKRLQPFLESLASYGRVIDVVVQVKPEILALIWGPIRLILKWSSELTNALDAMAGATLKISQALPQFEEIVRVFPDNVRVKAALALFYGDILDFYSAILKIFSASPKRWRQLWSLLWDSSSGKIDVVIKNITEHSLLMRNEVTIAEIVKADKARATSLKHFEEVKKYQELQNFQGLKARLGPVGYGERLDWLRNRVHEGSARWLFKDKIFQEWLNISNKETTWLWIQGIPGSGKTYLAAAAVDEVLKHHHQTLYVFASYKKQDSTTALSITQSLIFQAAAEETSLQTMVVEFSERDLASDGGRALELLKALLIASTGTYIIVDGLDEMEESERSILLQRLNDLTNATSELKILICSRLEDDITRALSKRSKSLRVDQRNLASIQGFVNHRKQEWLSHQDFDQSTVSEVSGLIAPLAARSNGMFLYARIVLDNLVELSSIEEIRRELKALPRDLNDAYQRVFNRINDSIPRVREKARKVLGWIGCAPAAMTSPEMEQALSLDGSNVGVPSIVGTTNFVRLCGPIVEIVDDQPQFVHFTVHDHQIDNFIDTAFANETLAISSASYLCSGVLDMDSVESAKYVQTNILAGDYRLLDYVARYWAGLTLKAVRNRSLSNEASDPKMLNDLISRAASEAENDDYQPDEESFKAKIDDRELYCGSDNARKMLRDACRFRLDERQPDWTMTNADTWVNLDPLTTSKTLVRVRECFESLLCHNDTHGPNKPNKPNKCSTECRWPTLQRHYGPRFYKCSYFSCPYSRHGFDSRQDRDKHEQAHGRPWKCPSVACEFSIIGFPSKKRMEIHINRFHEEESGPTVTLDDNKVAAFDLDNLDDDEAQPLLYILVRAGRVDLVKRLLASQSGSKIKSNVLAAARVSAAKQGSMTLTQLLTPEGETYLPTSIVEYAVKSEDVDFIDWAVARASLNDIYAGKFNKIMLDTSDEIYSLWETRLLGVGLEDSGLVKASVFNDVKNNALREERLIHTWKLLASEIAPSSTRYFIRDNFNKALLSLAKSSTSVRLGKALLELGASVDYNGVHRRGKTALAIAAKKTTKEAAEFMKMLLEHGASTRMWYGRGYNNEIGSIGDELGARGIHQWLGVTWEELVEITKDSWKTKYREPSLVWEG